MHRRGHMLRLTAVSVLVVLALTGFKGRGHGGSDGGGSGSGGGGGCSSSSQDHDSSSTSGGTSGSGYHDYDDDDDYGGTSGGSGSSSTLQDATVQLVSCASTDTPYATVKVTNPNSTGGYFTVTVDFLDAASRRVEQRTEDEFVAANETVSVQVDLSGAGVAAKVDHCAAEPYATAG
ncbi:MULTISPECIES: hypothetical protein [unclassified Streptomyces]|uniref:hypothetical protein n=1 Tax=unclassified Streptomyces TaxID=2593676 RepID=UPI00203557A8|nr:MULTISPECIES: hypothetical protein [unclassified Streptomyces]